jgi:hypothetical protein
MHKLKDRVILTDCDGVLLNWEYSFTIWMEVHGFERVPGGEYFYDLDRRFNVGREQVNKLVKIFNESAAIGFLPAFRDSVYYVKKLHQKHGFVFRAITSLSLDDSAGKLRESNLCKLFGDDVFESITFLDTNADKYDALLPYKDSGLYWIEDKYANFKTGIDLGLEGILVEHGHNMHTDITGGHVVKSWEDIYNIVKAGLRK